MADWALTVMQVMKSIPKRKNNFFIIFIDMYLVFFMRHALYI